MLKRGRREDKPKSLASHDGCPLRGGKDHLIIFLLAVKSRANDGMDRLWLLSLTTQGNSRRGNLVSLTFTELSGPPVLNYSIVKFLFSIDLRRSFEAMPNL